MLKLLYLCVCYFSPFYEVWFKIFLVGLSQARQGWSVRLVNVRDDDNQMAINFLVMRVIEVFCMAAFCGRKNVDDKSRFDSSDLKMTSFNCVMRIGSTRHWVSKFNWQNCILCYFLGLWCVPECVLLICYIYNRSTTRLPTFLPLLYVQGFLRQILPIGV